MSDNAEEIQSAVAVVEEWVTKVAGKGSVAPRDFLAECSSVRQKAADAYEALVSRSEATGRPEDPLVAGMEAAVMANESEVRDRMLQLVYDGELDPMAYYEALVEALARHSPLAHGFQKMRDIALKDAAAKGCAVCAACAACSMCAACGASVVAAAGVAGTAGAAAVYLA